MGPISDYILDGVKSKTTVKRRDIKTYVIMANFLHNLSEKK